MFKYQRNGYGWGIQIVTGLISLSDLLVMYSFRISHNDNTRGNRYKISQEACALWSLQVCLHKTYNFTLKLCVWWKCFSSCLSRFWSTQEVRCALKADIAGTERSSLLHLVLTENCDTDLEALALSVIPIALSLVQNCWVCACSWRWLEHANIKYILKS